MWSFINWVKFFSNYVCTCVLCESMPNQILNLMKRKANESLLCWKTRTKKALPHQIQWFLTMICIWSNFWWYFCWFSLRFSQDITIGLRYSSYNKWSDFTYLSKTLSVSVNVHINETTSNCFVFFFFSIIITPLSMYWTAAVKQTGWCDLK